jgi:DNA ligase-1
MADMLLADLVRASRAVGATRSRKAKVAALAAALGEAAPEEIETATSYLSGALRQRRTGLGWRSLGGRPSRAP